MVETDIPKNCNQNRTITLHLIFRLSRKIIFSQAAKFQSFKEGRQTGQTQPQNKGDGRHELGIDSHTNNEQEM